MELNDMLISLGVLAGCCWLFYKFYKTKSTRTLYAGILILLLQLSRWPLFLPIKICFALVSFSAAAMIFYDTYYKNKNKNAFIYIILFIGFGAVFLVEAFFKIYVKTG